MINRFKLIIVATVMTLFFACSAEQDSLQNGRVTKISSEGVEIELQSPQEELDFTALIPIHLSFTPHDLIVDPESLPQEGETWGDFRVKSYKQDSEGYSWLLIPRQIGESKLSPQPFVLWDGEDSQFYALSPEISFTVNSVLSEEKSDSFELIQKSEDSQKATWLWFLLIPFVLLLGLGIYLIIRQRSKKEGKELSSFEKLEQLYLQYKELDTEDSAKLREFAFTFFEELRDFLVSIELISESASPGEIVEKLEQPSPHNQWILRSLYPFLLSFDDHFYKSEGNQIEQKDFTASILQVLEGIKLLEEKHD